VRLGVAAGKIVERYDGKEYALVVVLKERMTRVRDNGM
jgi:hypothetical protein